MIGAHLSRAERQHPEPADRESGTCWPSWISRRVHRVPTPWRRSEWNTTRSTRRSHRTFWHGPGLVWGLSSRTEDDRLWVVSANSDTRPAVNYIYDRSAQTSRGILRSELDGCGPTAHAAGTHHPRDGLLLVSYLTKPDTVAPPPMVHGGAFVATNTLRLPNADREEHLHRPGNACWLPVWKWPACGLLFCGSHHRRHRPHRPSHRCA
jgi:hypothetical protein